MGTCPAIGTFTLYDFSAFPRGRRSLRKKNPKYEQTENTKGFRSPRL